jgi:hypothetical protein
VFGEDLMKINAKAGTMALGDFLFAGKVTLRSMFMIVAALSVGLAAASAQKGAHAQQVRGSDDWELVKVEDPFAEKSIQCQIRNRTVNDSGRRERPLIIFDLTSSRIVVRPDIALQGSVRANRALKGDTGDRGGHQEVLIRHGIRIDGNKLHSIEVRDDGSGSLEASFNSEVFAALSREAIGGQKIFYLWSVESSRRAYEYSIGALRQLIPNARDECARLMGN